MADEQLATAISTWGPRLCANGVDPNDVAEVTSTIERWDDWCAAWTSIGSRHEAIGRRALGEGRRRTAGEQLAEAATCYHFAKFLFVHDPAQLRDAHRSAVRALTDALGVLDPPGRRVEVPFDGARLAAVLRLPPGDGPHPVVVLVAGLDSAKEEFRLVEAAFLDRGVGTFAVDGPGQGESEAALSIRPDWEAPGRAILDHLVGVDGVDAERVGVWGVSLGGYYAPRWAALDRRVRACIALSGPYDLAAAWDGLPDLTRAAFTARARARDAGEARALAGRFSLASVASALACPLLVVFGKRDRLFPYEGAERLVADASGERELLLLDEGGHGCANVVYRHRPYAADWMARQLGA